jgi:hypothetical protein
VDVSAVNILILYKLKDIYKHKTYVDIKSSKI